MVTPGRLLTGVYWRWRFTGAGQWPAGSTGEDMQTDETYVRQGLKRVDGWLFPYSVDFIRSLAALQRDTGIAGSVGEIGVHHGKLFILLALARQAGEGAFAVDVFGDQHLNRDASGRGDREIFLGNVSRWLGNPETVTVLQRSSLEVRPEDKIGRASCRERVCMYG